MPPVIVAHVDDPSSWTTVQQEFAVRNSGYALGQGTVASEIETVLDIAEGRARYCWLFAGDGEVWLPSGYRTQEGDGNSLPVQYRPDPLGRVTQEALAAVRAVTAEGALLSVVQAPIEAILARWQEGSDTFVGDIAGEVWRLLESGVPPKAWLPGMAGEALRWLANNSHRLGWSAKQSDSWESLTVGDQLVVTQTAPVRVRGSFRYWWIEDLERDSRDISAVRRLRYLQDTAGGCAPGFDAFRRLPLTWAATSTSIGDDVPPILADGEPDGVNRVNCHTLNIASELSRTHYHPLEAIGGGKPQFEMYFTLNPVGWSLGTAGRSGCLYTFPEVGRWSFSEVTELKPGTIALIPPHTGHRGCDAFVQVVTLPGFKPGNELYLDRLIRDATEGQSPHNAELAAAEHLTDPDELVIT